MRGLNKIISLKIIGYLTISIPFILYLIFLTQIPSNDRISMALGFVLVFFAYLISTPVIIGLNAAGIQPWHLVVGLISLESIYRILLFATVSRDWNYIFYSEQYNFFISHMPILAFITVISIGFQIVIYCIEKKKNHMK